MQDGCHVNATGSLLRWFLPQPKACTGFFWSVLHWQHPALLAAATFTRQVSMRACARDVGLLAIQAALVERCREEDLGAERKALLAALAAPGGRSVRDIAAGDARGAVDNVSGAVV
jgi:hypothetical protein